MGVQTISQEPQRAPNGRETIRSPWWLPMGKIPSGAERLGNDTQPGDFLPMGHVKFRQVRLGFGERLQPVLNDFRQAFALQDHRVSLRRLAKIVQDRKRVGVLFQKVSQVVLIFQLTGLGIKNILLKFRPGLGTPPGLAPLGRSPGLPQRQCRVGRPGVRAGSASKNPWV